MADRHIFGTAAVGVGPKGARSGMCGGMHTAAARRAAVPTAAALLAVVLAAPLAVAGCGRGSAGGARPAPAALPSAGSAGPAPAATGPSAPGPSGTGGRPARPDHIVVVVLENHSDTQVLQSAPYLRGLAARGATLTASYAVTHPSEPNYLALFSGSTQGLTDDSCPHAYGGDDLGHQLVAAGLSFVGYSEGLPAEGYTGCRSGRYARKHNPWVNFANVPASSNAPLTRFPTDYSALPTVAFVVPDLCNDMHDCAVATGDQWLARTLDGYARWAATHNSVLVVTFDEDDRSAGNRILTVLVGEPVRPGRYPARVTHYGLLRAIEDAYGLPCLGAACAAAPRFGAPAGEAGPLDG
jgi:phosphatidylinositol-3-phosphatase